MTVFDMINAIYDDKPLLVIGANKSRFCNNSDIDTLFSKPISVENKVKLSQLTRADFVALAKLIQ